jgi:hypothetical protein
LRRILSPAAAVVGALAVLALPAAASAQGPSNLVCNGTYSGIYASVTVPPNGNCSLDNATVLGGATVLSAGQLSLADSAPATINGPVVVGRGATYNQYSQATVGGTITAQNAAFLDVLGGITHSIVTNATGFVEVTSATVNGSVAVNQTTQTFAYIAANPSITGDVVVNATAGGAGNEVTLNTVGGSVYLTNNRASPDDVYLNTIQNNLVCTGNNPPPGYEDYGNYVKGRELGQCASFPSDSRLGATE